MLVIRCTTKLRKVGGWPVEDPADAGDREWYANLLWFDRRKCVLFAHATTLYTLFAPDVRKKDLENLGALLQHRLCDQLIFDGIDLNDADPVLGLREPSVVGVARDRSILGSMRELAYGYEWRIAEAGGPQHLPSRPAASEVNETLMSRIDMASPIDAMRALLGYPPRRYSLKGID